MPTQLAPQLWLYRAGEQPQPTGLSLLVQPSDAFGDGRHPTTRACARAVDLLCRQQEPRAVLDVGTGTGVLARIARARGAKVIVATDIDAPARAAAKANVALDISDVPIEISAAQPDAWGATFDLVVANILEGVLIELAPRLVGALRPGGTLVLSGFRPAQNPALRARFEALGLKNPRHSVHDEWSLLTLQRPASATGESAQ